MEYLALTGWSFCVLLLIFLLHERTTSKHLRQELESLRLRALETANAPAVLAHEIRTPLALIRGAGELLSEGMAGELTDTQRQFLHTMMTNTQRVIALAESMLTDLKTAFIRPRSPQSPWIFARSWPPPPGKCAGSAILRFEWTRPAGSSSSPRTRQ